MIRFGTPCSLTTISFDASFAKVSRYGHTSNLEIHFCRILFSVLKGTQKICASSVPLTLSSLWLRVVPFASGISQVTMRILGMTSSPCFCILRSISFFQGTLDPTYKQSVHLCQANLEVLGVCPILQPIKLQTQHIMDERPITKVMLDSN